jgi:hypothetical protein
MQKMEQTQKKNKTMWWILGILSLVACIYMIMFMSNFFWITLPLLLTSFAQALDGL